VAGIVGEHFCRRMKTNAFRCARHGFMILLFGGLAGDGWASDPKSPVVAVAPARPKPPELHAILLQAIREKRVLRFTYRGHARVVEPHAYGRNTKGDAVLHAFQTEGGSASRPPPGWRTFSADAIESPELGERTFAQAHDGYSPNELRLDPLWAEVPAVAVEE
jgi:hypothetical protein